MGTVGGDLCQRPRCWYFRNGFGLLGDEERQESGRRRPERVPRHLRQRPGVLRVSASSLGPALIALGATLKVVGPSGHSRRWRSAKFFLTPTADNQREIDLKPNEIVTEIVVPPARGAKNATYEVRQKEALDWPLAAASVSLTMKGSSVASARIVLGHVAPTPWVASAAESMLAGKSITEDVADRRGQGRRRRGPSRSAGTSTKSSLPASR